MKTLKIFLFLLFFSVLFILFQGAKADAQTTSPDLTGISITVKSSSGTPITNATVKITLNGLKPPPNYCTVPGARSTGTHDAKHEGGGKYTLGNVCCNISGFSVTVSANGFKTQTKNYAQGQFTLTNNGSVSFNDTITLVPDSPPPQAKCVNNDPCTANQVGNTTCLSNSTPKRCDQFGSIYCWVPLNACLANQTCQNGTCVGNPPPATSTPVPPNTSTPTPTLPPGITSTPIPTSTPGIQNTPTPFPTPTPDFNNAMCKCDQMNVGQIALGQPIQVEAFAKVEGQDTSKAEVRGMKFRIYEGNASSGRVTELSEQGNQPVTVVNNTPSLVRYRSEWSTSPTLKTGTEYRIVATPDCAQKTARVMESELQTAVLAERDENVGLFGQIVNFFAGLFGRGSEVQNTGVTIEKENKSPIQILTDFFRPQQQDTGDQIQLETFRPAQMQKEACNIVKFSF